MYYNTTDDDDDGEQTREGKNSEAGEKGICLGEVSEELDLDSRDSLEGQKWAQLGTNKGRPAFGRPC